MSMVSLDQAPPARPRADAARNRDRIAMAAHEVFAERGLEACVQDVAARAGVDKATVYRNFSTKDELMRAVVCSRLEWFKRLADEAAESPDPWRAFSRLMMTVADAQAGNRAVADSMDSRRDTSEVRAARAAAVESIDRLMHCAKRQGAMRANAASRDILGSVPFQVEGLIV